MKKVSLQVNGIKNENNAAQVQNALNDLSGVVAAHISTTDNVAYAYAGDRLSKDVMINAVRNIGYESGVINEEYLNGVQEIKNSLS